MKFRYLKYIIVLAVFFALIKKTEAQISVMFSHQRGVYEESFDLTINTSGYNVAVKYTLDGSEPSTANGISPVNVNEFTIANINRSTAVRVLVYNIEEKVYKTHTYIFPADVFSQNNNSVINQLTYPSNWGYGSALLGVINCRRQAADYDMNIDTCITKIDDYEQKMINGLMELPIMAVSLDKFQVFGADSGIYVFPVEQSDTCYTLPSDVQSWERKASVEIFNDVQGTDTLQFQFNAGLQMSGASTRYLDFYKHSFKLKFRSEYGTSKLRYPLYGDESVEKFESLQLRMVGHSSPNDPSANGRNEAQLHKDGWTRDLQRKMSGYGSSANSKFFHLFINGLYWGTYDVTERPDADFMSEYNGGAPEDYEVIKINELKTGTDSVYRYMYDLGHSIYDTVSFRPVPNQNRRVSFYDEIKQVLDIDKFIDYSLLNLYFVNNDWVENNWWVARNGEQNGKFQFFVWDAEFVLNYVHLNYNKVLFAGNAGDRYKYHPADLNQRLLDVPEYKIKFGDHIQCNCVEEDGILNAQNLIESYNLAEEKIHNASILEFARWGDSRKLDLNYEPFCHDVIEQTKQKYNTEIFPNLLNYMLEIYGDRGREFKLFPKHVKINSQNGATVFNDIFYFKAVQFPQLGGEVPVGYELDLTNLNTTYNSNNQIVPLGDIYYTTDGSDPRNIDGSISSSAIKYTSPILIDEYKMIKARVYTDLFTYRNSGPKSIDSLWTAMCPREFFPQGYYNDLVINEIHYNPADLGTISGSNLEFLELKNTGENEINLSNTKFTSGIQYEFPMNTIVPSNGYMLLVSDSITAKNYYNVVVDGEYQGKLENGGELLLWVRPDGEEIDQVQYDDVAPWNVKPDGNGSSLSLYLNSNEIENNHLAESWGSSATDYTPKAENIFCVPMMLNVTSISPSCFNGNDGYAGLSVSGGSQPYSFLWSTNNTENYITNLVSGTYEVEVIDDQNCAKTQIITISDPAQITSNLQLTHATFASSADGIATINPTNVPAGYNVVWSDGSTGDSNYNLAPNNNYWVTITDNRNDNCAITESFFVEVASSCTTPYNISATSLSESSAIISWLGSSDNSSYQLSFKALGATTWNTVTNTIPRILLNNLNPCTTYEFKVIANCNAVTSNSSFINNFTTKGCINTCNGGNVNGNTINITSYSAFILWDIIPNAKYRLNYRKNGVTNWHQYETNYNFSILFGLKNCSNYEWYVDIICPDGTINSNNINNFTTSDCLRINDTTNINDEEIINDFDFKLYPNPAQNFINISSNTAQNSESKILIYDFSGKFVKDGGVFTSKKTLNIEELNVGMYVMQVVNENYNLQYTFKKNN